MKIQARFLAILLTGLMGCTEEELNREVEVEISPTYVEVNHGENITVSYSVNAPDGLSIIKSAVDGNWSVVKQFSGEKEFEGSYSFDAFIYDVGLWEPSIKDSIQVVIYAQDLDGDISYKRAVVKVLAP